MYRRSDGKEIWHSNAGCSVWPLLDFDEKEAPEGGLVCEQCVEIELMVRHQCRIQSPVFDPVYTHSALIGGVRSSRHRTIDKPGIGNRRLNVRAPWQSIACSKVGFGTV